MMFSPIMLCVLVCIARTTARLETENPMDVIIPKNCALDYKKGILNCSGALYETIPAEFVYSNTRNETTEESSNDDRVRTLLNCVETLKLSSNPISTVPIFKKSSVRYLHLDICNITTLEYGTFDALHMLNTLNLSHNIIEELPNNMSFRSLKVLDLSCNKIRNVYSEQFKNLKKLYYLNLSNNLLTVVWGNSFFLDTITVLAINNPWNCRKSCLKMKVLEEPVNEEVFGDKCLYNNITVKFHQQCTHVTQAKSKKHITIIALMLIGVIFLGMVITTALCFFQFSD